MRSSLSFLPLGIFGRGTVRPGKRLALVGRQRGRRVAFRQIRPELLQQPFVAERFHVHVLFRVRDIPAVLGFSLQLRVIFGQVAQLLELRGEVAVNLAGTLRQCRRSRENSGRATRSFQDGLPISSNSRRVAA